jgi:hypothetical protein
LAANAAGDSKKLSASDCSDVVAPRLLMPLMSADTIEERRKD